MTAVPGLGERCIDCKLDARGRLLRGSRVQCDSSPLSDNELQMSSNSACHPNQSRTIQVSRQDNDGGSKPRDDRPPL